MELTDYHAKYIAYQLTRRCPPDSVEKLAAALVDAQVDLNPHQIDAALFAFRSPLSKGALLADEVGLGKTIEAGLVLSQKWAERKRRILVIVPSNLRTQWYQELTEKFFLPCRILESKSYNTATKQGQFRPFEAAEIVICSYQFAKSKASDVHALPWDLVVIDEAHRLRNVYKPQNVIANTLKLALAGRDKLLLTATPLQNSLLELFGLVSFIDEHAFGDLKSFREQFANLNQEQVFQTLKARLKPVCHRTLRRQVLPYIKYTRRWPLVQDFKPEESEDRLYHLVSDYLQRDNLQALPASQRSLMTLVLRKLLASSTFAIAGALTTISARLKAKLGKQEPAESLEEQLDQDYETLDETAEEWADDESEAPLSDHRRQGLRATRLRRRGFDIRRHLCPLPDALPFHAGCGFAAPRRRARRSADWRLRGGRAWANPNRAHAIGARSARWLRPWSARRAPRGCAAATASRARASGPPSPAFTLRPASSPSSTAWRGVICTGDSKRRISSAADGISAASPALRRNTPAQSRPRNTPAN